MNNDLYLASTPLHILNSVAIASSRKASEAHLILIDQADAKTNPYYQLLINWKSSPFRTVHIFPGRIKGLRQRLSSRKRVFQQITEIISDLNPGCIFTGNDRRIEFQYAMHCQEKINRRCAVGVYMDEGTYTYIGREASLSISDKYIDNTVKKLIYGFWWENPATIGASSWIKEIYAAYPSEVHDLLTSKTCHSLQPCYTSNPVIESFCSELVSKFNTDIREIRSLDAVLTLPHESIIEGISNYKQSMETALEQLLNAGMRVGVKHHPRNITEDILTRSDNKNIYIMPEELPFEATLPLLHDCIIVGDVSSALINARWLKPGSKILSITNPLNPFSDAFEALFHNIGVESLEVTELDNKLKQVLHA